MIQLLRMYVKVQKYNKQFRMLIKYINNNIVTSIDSINKIKYIYIYM